MSNSFYIRVPDATEIDTGYGTFKCEMDDVIDRAATSVESLVYLDALSGQGADAIKAYFSQVHDVLLYLLSLLVNELDTIYNSPYYTGVLSAARNDEAGEFPSWDMWDKARAFQNFADNDTPPIDSLLRAAVQAAPAGYSFSTPSTASFKDGMGTKSRKLDTTRENFENTESAGINALSHADENYQKLFRALTEAIARCANGSISMASYKNGDFRVACADLGLQEIALNAEEEQTAKSEAVITAKEQGAANRDLDIERARREAEEAKHAWAVGGEVLQMVILGTAIAGLCVATGGVAIAFAAVGVASAAYGTYQREKQLSDMKKDARADIGKSDAVAGTLNGIKGVKDYGKGFDTIARNARQIADDQANGLQFGPDGAMRNIDRTAAGMLVSFGTGIIGDAVDERFGDNLEGDAALAYKEGKKITEKVIDKGSEKALENALPKMKLADSFKGQSILDKVDVSPKTQKTVGSVAGWVGFAAGCGQIYTDYQVEQYDKALDKCESDRQNNEAYKQALSSGSSHQWAVQW